MDELQDMGELHARRKSLKELHVWIPSNRSYDSGEPAGMDGLNEIIDANRRNKYVGARLEQEDVLWCAWYIRMAMVKAGWKPLDSATACECAVHMKIVEPNCRRDVPNVYAGTAKYTLDACTARHQSGSGAIYDDSVRWLKAFSQEIEVDPERPGIDLTITRLDSNDKR